MKNEVEEIIWDEVWFGFNDDEEIISIIQDNVLENPNEAKLKNKILEFRSLKKKSERYWKKDSDFLNLYKAFNDLNSQGIISIHFAGYTNSDCVAEVSHIYNNYFNENSKIIGYCAYHEQSLKQLIPEFGSNDLMSGELELLFGDIKGNNEKGIIIGKKITNVLNNYGLETEWNENINLKIIIKNFKWEKKCDDLTLDRLYNTSIENLNTHVNGSQ